MGLATVAHQRASTIRRRWAVARRQAPQAPPLGPGGLLGVGLSALVGAASLLATLYFIGRIGLFVGVNAYVWYTRTLPPVAAAVERSVFKTTSIYDRNGRLLYEIWDPTGGRRTVVPLREMPPHLIAATLATEDAEFYHNPGFDLKAIVRALFQNARRQGIVSGGSTITQQLVRNTLFSPAERFETSYSRKLKEVILAYQLNQRYSKDEILERYLNEIYFGNLAYGVEAAAQTYFDKHVQELTLAEATFLAGLPQAPAVYDPFANPRAARQRQQDVLGLMVRHGFLSPEEAGEAERAELRFRQPTRPLKAPHFSMFVRSLLERRYPADRLYHGGLEVHTTLDLDLQEEAERTIREHLGQLRPLNANNAALVAIDPPTGEILAMVGSADFWDDRILGQVNMALAERQPGSTLKPFTYLTAFRLGLASPATVIVDEPTAFPGAPGGPPYRPQNPDGRFRGPVTVRSALGNSLNVPAVKMLQRVGLPAMIETVHRFGVTGLDEPERYGLSLTLGGGAVRLLDLTYAYAVLANEGIQVGEPVQSGQQRYGQRERRPVAIRRVVDGGGQVLEEYRSPEGLPVAGRDVVWLITDILADDAARAETYGRNSALKLSRPAAAKTGTTDNFEDSWTIGYTPDLAVGVWVGNAANEPMREVSGVAGAGLIWRDYLERALRGRPGRDFRRPPDIVRASVDARTGQHPIPGQPTITDWFLERPGPFPSAVGPVIPTPSPTPNTRRGDGATGATGRRDDGATSPITPTSAASTPSASAAPTRTPTPSPTTQPRRTSTATAPATPTPSPAATPSPSPAATPTASATARPTRTPTAMATPSATANRPGDLAEVPAVFALPEAEARRLIGRAGLTVGPITYRTDAELDDDRLLAIVRPGHVLSQLPPAGVAVRRGTVVYLVVRR